MVPELVNHNNKITYENERTAFHSSSSSSSSSVNTTSTTSMHRRLRNHNRRHPLSSFGILVTAFVLIAAVVSTVTNYMGIVFNNNHGNGIGNGDSESGAFIFTGNNNNHNNNDVEIDTDANIDTDTNSNTDTDTTNTNTEIVDNDFGDADIDISVLGVGVGGSIGVGVGGVNHCCYGQNDWKDTSIDAEYCKRNKGNDKDNSCVGKHSSKPCGTTTISATCCLQSNFNNHVYKANKCIKRVCYPTCSSS